MTEEYSRPATLDDLEGIPVRTVNLEGLLLTKQAMREKDVSDRIVLEKALKVMRERSRR